MKINQEWKQRENIIKLELRDLKEQQKEAMQAFAYDMKTLKEEIAKNPSEWDCDLINNMSLCAKDRNEELKVIRYNIERLESERKTNAWKKYDI